MKRSHIWVVIGLLGLAMVLALAVREVPAGQLDAAEYAPVVVRAYYQDEAMVRRLATWTEPWIVNQAEGYALLGVTPADYDRLIAEGFRLEIDTAKTAELSRPRQPLPDQGSGIPGYACYRTVEETYASAQQLATDYPTLATWTDIGDSWEKTQNQFDGYDMMALRLTNQAIGGTKPVLYVQGGIHAREYTTAETATRFAEYLLENYGVDADATWLLDYHEIHLVLQVNPDGRKQAETGILWRKNTDNNDGCVAFPNYGVDLNRNYQFQWGCCNGSSPLACEEIYRGPSAASEPETQATQDYGFAIFPDQRPADLTTPAPITSTGIFIDLHSYAQEILWSWGFTTDPAPNATGLQTLARKWGYLNGYAPTQSLYPTDGTTKDFFYGEFGVPGYTIEMGTDFFESCSNFENEVYPDNLPVLLYAAKAAAAPYTIPSGPDTLNVTLSGDHIVPGVPLTLTAQLNDTRYNNSQGTEPTQPIAAAEYYIDIPPWQNGAVAQAMTAADGNFNSTIENARAVVNTTGLNNGRHILYLRGRDTANNWGAISAIFLNVFDPAVAPVIQGYVREEGTNIPLAATVSAGQTYQTTTNPTTGFYSMQVLSGTYSLAAIASGHSQQVIPNVTAADHQTVEQDFSLTPLCAVFSDGAEAGNIGWTAQSPWGITSEAAHDGTYSWTDSPGGNYTANRNVSLTSPLLNLSSYQSAGLNFWHICDTADANDVCHVEISDNGGVNWTEVASFSGPHSQWEEVVVAVPALNGQSDARIRFRFTSNATVAGDGWHIDDIRLVGDSLQCGSPIAPNAAFSSTSPDALGTATSFSNSSTGTDLTYQWDFGDGSPTNPAANPQHTYTAVGVYTVTLTASNSLGDDTATGQVTIAVVPQAAFTSTTPDELGQPTSFTNTSAGTNLTYQWDFGDGSPTSTAANPQHSYAAVGNYLVTLTVTNILGSDSYTAGVQIFPAGTSYRIYLPVVVNLPD